jgi:tripartite-type tricarboxylate transporter receptor subunit TctC
MNQFTRRQFVKIAAGASSVMLGAPAFAQEFPSKPIRVIIPVPAGAGPDADTRPLAEYLRASLGQPVIIENRPGASTRIATEIVAKAAPDGYTLMIATPSMLLASLLYSKLPYDVQRDLVPVSLLSETYYTLTVNASVPAHSAKEYVGLVRTNPMMGNVGTYGIGTTPHLAGAWFSEAARVDFKFIHYNNTPPFSDLMSGQIQAVFDAMLPMSGGLQAGKLRSLAVSGKSRQPALPGVPTFAEAGFESFNPVVWIGVVAPAKTPKPIVKRLSEAFAKAAQMPDIVKARRDAASQSMGSTPEEFAAYLDAEREKWGSVIRRLGLKLES